MRRCSSLALLILVGVTAGAALAMPSAPAASDGAVAEAQSAVEESRVLMEARYVVVAAQHEHVRGLAAEVRDGRKTDELPEWITGERIVAALGALAADARSNADADAERVEEYTPLTGFLPPRAARWPAWSAAVIDRARAFARVDAETGPSDLLAQALLVVADTPTDVAWDAWFQSDPVVVEWRARNERLGLARAVVAAREPTALVPLEKARVEVGPWQGWIQDLGAKDNRRTKVSVKALYVDRHEVNCAQYHVYLLSLEPAERAAALPAGWEIDADGVPLLPTARAAHPVTGVTFDQARAYAASLGKRLPTEDEWERIASGGDASRTFPWGPEAGRRRWAHQADGVERTGPVGAHPDDASPEGVLDLAGSVKEMVATTSDRKPVKGQAKDGARIVVRGGGFRTRANECRTTFRWFVEAGQTADDVGFRCVMDETEFRRRNPR